MAQIHTNLFASDIQVLIKALSGFFLLVFFGCSAYMPVMKKMLKTTQFFSKEYIY